MGHWHGMERYCRKWYGVVNIVIANIVFHLGHTNTIGCHEHSPSATAFISCSDDNRARFWYSEGI